MDAFLHILTLGGFYFGNGCLVVAYTALDHAPVLLVLPPLVWLGLTSASAQRQLAWFVCALTLVATAGATGPVPLLLVVMAWAGAAAVWHDAFAPNTLRLRVLGALGLESVAALGVLLTWAYLNNLPPAEFGALFAVDEAGALLAQGRAFLNTLTVLGVWFGLPLGYFALLLQGLFVHAPLGATPEQLMRRVRNRE